MNPLDAKPDMDAITAVTHADPHPYYTLQLTRPLHFDADTGLWLAARAADVEAVLRHPACRVRPLAEPVPKALRDSAAGSLFGNLARMNDGAAHAAIKAVLGTALELPLRHHAHRAAQRLSAAWSDSPLPEALDHYLCAMPVYSLAGLLDVPEHQQAALLQKIAALAGGLSPLADDARRSAAGQATEVLRRDFAALLRERHAELPERLAQGARQTEIAIDVLVDNAIGLLWQSFDASAGLIGNSLVQLARRPELRHDLCANQMGLAGLIAEVARFDAPIQNTRRFLAEDALIDGVRLPAGACVLVLLAAANLDASANPQPERFDPARPARRCWTFGSGAHACPGARLAHGIAAAAVTQALERWPEALWQTLAAPRYRASLNARIPAFAEGDH